MDAWFGRVLRRAGRGVWISLAAATAVLPAAALAAPPPRPPSSSHLAAAKAADCQFSFSLSVLPPADTGDFHPGTFQSRDTSPSLPKPRSRR